MAETQSEKKLRITWMVSAIGETVRHKATIRALGLHRLHETVEHVDSPALRGMLYLVRKLVRIEESE
jgi:large subunit ribosomal protein L30